MPHDGRARTLVKLRMRSLAADSLSQIHHQHRVIGLQTMEDDSKQQIRIIFVRHSGLGTHISVGLQISAAGSNPYSSCNRSVRILDRLRNG